MDHFPITNLFNAYDLQLNPFEKDKIHSQEVVNYFEDRFRVALQALMERCEDDQQWMYKVLFRELVFVTSLTSSASKAINFRNCVLPMLGWQRRLANHSISGLLSELWVRTCTESA